MVTIRQFSAILLVVVVLLSLSSCERASLPTPANGQDTAAGVIWPMAEGNYWLYRWSDDGLEFRSMDTIRAGRPFHEENLTGLWSYITLPGLNGYFQPDSLGILIAEIDSSEFTGAGRMLLHPARAAERWTFRFESLLIRTTFVGANRAVSVPAANFTGCREYWFAFDYGNGYTKDLTYYFRPGAGPVKAVEAQHTPWGSTNTRIYELVAWKIVAP